MGEVEDFREGKLWDLEFGFGVGGEGRGGEGDERFGVGHDHVGHG